MNFAIAVRLWILISLYYFLPQIQEKVKIINFNESGSIGLSTSNVLGMKSKSPLRLWILSALYHLKPQIHEKSENYQFQ